MLHLVFFFFEFRVCCSLRSWPRRVSTNDPIWWLVGYGKEVLGSQSLLDHLDLFRVRYCQYCRDDCRDWISESELLDCSGTSFFQAKLNDRKERWKALWKDALWWSTAPLATFASWMTFAAHGTLAIWRIGRGDNWGRAGRCALSSWFRSGQYQVIFKNLFFYMVLSYEAASTTGQGLKSCWILRLCPVTKGSNPQSSALSISLGWEMWLWYVGPLGRTANIAVRKRKPQVINVCFE